MTKPLTLWLRFLNDRGINENPVLLRENEWVRVYRVSSGLEFRESKFLTGETSITTDLIVQRWDSMSADDKVEFIQAYVVKSTFSDTDQNVIDALLNLVNEQTALVLAHVLPKFNNRAKAMNFIKEHLARDPELPLASYFEAAARIKDQDSITVLRAKFDHYRKFAKSLGRTGRLNLLYCSYALWKIAGVAEYEEVMREFLSSDDQTIKTNAQRLIDESND
jgi:hypothetical protein